MSLPGFATQTVKVWRAPLTPDHGVRIRDWSQAVSHDVAGCSIQPAGGSADLVNRTAVTTRWTVYAEVDADIIDSDRVEIFGTRYAVDGPVQRWETGVLDHLLIPLKNVEG